MQPPQDENALIKLAAECDDDAFSLLIGRYRRHLYGIVAKYAAGREEREDLQSEVIAKLLENSKQALRNWRPSAPFAAYFTTIATRHCMLSSRRDGRLQTVPLTPLPGDPGGRPMDLLDRLIPTDHSDEPEVALERSEMQLALTGALGDLHDTDRLVLAMRFRDGMSGPDMASVLGITHGAVRQRILKAVRRLEVVLRERSPDMFRGPENQ